MNLFMGDTSGPEAAEPVSRSYGGSGVHSIA